MKQKIRKEKTCLNCGAHVAEIYCPHCGQENTEPRESFGALLYHFFADFTHFDSKFFRTMKDLVWRPGFLTKAYLAGKRKSYLHPIKMYIFISFLFFLCLGLVNRKDHEKNQAVEISNEAVAEKLATTLDSLKNDPEVDSATLHAIKHNFNKAVVNARMLDYSTLEAYDSAQNSLPPDLRARKVARYIERKRIAWKEKYPLQSHDMIKEKFVHAIPKIMFLLLPLFALFLKWFYRRKYYYVDHAIFSLHFHSLAFMLMLVSLLADRLFNISIFESYAILLLFIYLVAALHRVYQQSIVRSFFKALALTIMYSIAICVVLASAAIIIFITV